MAQEERIADDRNDISVGDSTALIVEDDPHYARVLVGVARNKGFKVIVANRGRDASRPGPPISSRYHHAGYFSAGHAWMDSAQQA